MHQGNWQCSGCSNVITQLPFEPKSTNNLLCKDCFSNKRGSQAPSDGGDRKMFSGNWQCSGCNGAINELPFQPRETGNLLCRDCFKKKVAA